MKRGILTLLTIAAMLLGLMGNASAETPITVKVNGSEIQFPDAHPFIDPSSGRTMIPIRFVSEELGAHVSWNQTTKVVSMLKPGTTTLSIFLKIGENKAKVNGIDKVFDAKAVLVNNRTFVPLRFVSETMGAKVEWLAAERTVVITTPTAAVVKPPENGLPANPPPRPGQIENVEALKRMAAALLVENGILKGTVPNDVVGFVLVQFKGENNTLAKTKYLKPGQSFELKLTDDKGGIALLGQNGTAFGAVGIEYPSMEIVNTH